MAIHSCAIVFNPKSRPYGLSYADWSAEWCKWLLSIPRQKSPVLDATGKNAAQSQHGDVWFLAGTMGGLASRQCVVPAGRAILFPIVVKECSFAEDTDLKTEDELHARAKEDIDRTISLEADIDGIKLLRLEKYRIDSEAFSVTFPKHNIYNVRSGHTRAVCSGYWILLKPFSQGVHAIRFGATVYVPPGSVLYEMSTKYNRMDGSFFNTHTTYVITVKTSRQNHQM